MVITEKKNDKDCLTPNHSSTHLNETESFLSTWKVTWKKQTSTIQLDFLQAGFQGTTFHREAEDGNCQTLVSQSPPS